MSLKWTDETGYSQTEKPPRVPRVWRAKVPGMKISVHRYHGLQGWYLTCLDLDIELQALKPEDVAQARIQASAMIQVALEKRIKAYQSVIEKICEPGALPMEERDR